MHIKHCKRKYPGKISILSPLMTPCGWERNNLINFKKKFNHCKIFSGKFSLRLQFSTKQMYGSTMNSQRKLNLNPSQKQPCFLEPILKKLVYEHSAFVPPAGNNVPHTVLNSEVQCLKRCALNQNKPFLPIPNRPPQLTLSTCLILRSCCEKTSEAMDDWRQDKPLRRAAGKSLLKERICSPQFKTSS